MGSLDTVTPDGSRVALPIIRISARGTFAVVDLRGSAHKGTVDVFHVGTGKRATPRRHFEKIRTRTVCVKLAEWLDTLDPVDDAGDLNVDRATYHARFDDFVRTLAG